MKAILLVRVSTQKQDFDAQESELYNLAINDGYTEKGIICIAEKESAIKLSETERSGLNRMKEAIENDSTINCVYAWEISRIARTKKVLFSILEYLFNKQIQLIIKEPYLRLLNEDKSINEASETIFTLYAQLAETEMRNKKSRFKRAKIALAKEGSFIGGIYIRFGYEVIDKKYVIKEDEAKTIRMIYDMYVRQGLSQSKILEELRERGIVKNLNTSFITRILNDKAYTGEIFKSKKIEMRYPMIINKELYSKAREIANKNNINADKTKHLYFCKSLIKCQDCGSGMIANNHDVQYMCCAKKTNRNCNEHTRININIIDSIAFFVANNILSREFIINTKTDIEEYKEKIKVLSEKINNIQNEIKNKELSINKQMIFYERDLITIEVFNKKIYTLQKEIENFNNKRVEYENEIESIERIISNNQNIIENKQHQSEYIEESYNRYKDASDEIKYELIQNTIKAITVKNVEAHKLKYIEIIDNIYNYTHRFYIYVNSKKIYMKANTNRIETINTKYFNNSRYELTNIEIFNRIIMSEKTKNSRNKYLKEYRAKKREEINTNRREKRTKKKMEQNKGEA